MPTVCFYGPGLAGKTMTIQQIARARGHTVTAVATETERTLLATRAGDIRLVTVPGSVFYDINRRIPLLEADALVFTLDTQVEQLENNLEIFEQHPGEVRLAPRIYQLNKVDLPNSISMRARLPEVGWEPGMRVVETVAYQGTGVGELFEAIVQMLDELGPGSRVKQAVQAAFPERGAEILDALDRRWLGWGVRRAVRCACGMFDVVRIGSGDAVDVEGAETGPALPGGRLPPLPATTLTRDLLLGELRRALSEAEFARVERACGRDLEERVAECIWCHKPLPLRAEFNGSLWSVTA